MDKLVLVNYIVSKSSSEVIADVVLPPAGSRR